MTMTVYLDITRYVVPQSQSLQLLVGQLSDVAADVHVDAAAL